MKPVDFRYHRPARVQDALALLETRADSMPLAGGQSLLPLLNRRVVRPRDLIDLGAIDRLRDIEQGSVSLRLGAMVVHSRLERPDIASACPVLAEAASQIASRAIRNRGTIGGSLAQGMPAAELPLVAMLLAASIDLQSVDAARTVDAQTFFRRTRGELRTHPVEMITSVTFPVWPDGHGWAFLESSPRHNDYPRMDAAVVCTFDRRRRPDRLQIAVGGLGRHPIRLLDLEDRLIGSQIGESALSSVAAKARRIAREHSGARYGPHREEFVGALVRRAVERAFARARERKLSAR